VAADTVKQFIVFLPIRLEIEAEIENGLTDPRTLFEPMLTIYKRF